MLNYMKKLYLTKNQIGSFLKQVLAKKGQTCSLLRSNGLLYVSVFDAVCKRFVQNIDTHLKRMLCFQVHLLFLEY